MTRPNDELTTGLCADERGMSEVIAFTLVFAIIISSVVFLSMTGLQAMNDYQTSEQSLNAERAMTSLTANFNDVVQYDGVEKRYGELALRGGRVTADTGGTSVTIETSGGTLDTSYDLGAFTYESESGVIAYEGGGLIRATDESSVFLEEPMFTCNDDAALVSLVRIDSERSPLRSDGNVGVTMTRTGRTRTVYDTSKVTVTVDDPATEYDRAWQSIGTNGEWTCSGVDRVAVTVVTVTVDY